MTLFSIRDIRLVALVLLLSTAASCAQQSSGAPTPATVQASPVANEYSAAANRLIDAALADSTAYRRVGTIVDQFGARFSGTPQLEAAIDWILAKMREDGLENVRGEPVMVPRWVRGEESLELLSPRRLKLRMLGLGGSVATPASGITAPVLVVSSFDELARRASEARGRIVLYDVPFTSYRETNRYRVQGASQAARVGAVAALVRSIASASMQSPHTGNMRYDSAVTRIPTAAVSVEDAMMLHRMQDRGERVTVTLRMGASTLPDAPSRNVVAELRGRERPDEIVVIGGHIDSWDVGQGAMDDAGGSFVAWEAVRLMKRLGLRPRRTVRVVLWTNEENGGRGAAAYRDTHAAEIDKHVLAIESDNGTFSPTGFNVSGSDATLAVAQSIGPLLARIGAGRIEQEREGPEADIAPLVALGVPGMGLKVDRTRYFWYHHSEADTFDKLDAAEVARCAAAMAVMAYVVAEMPAALPRRDTAP
jgi:carboxypeptidase Q